MLARGTEDKEYAMLQKLNSEIGPFGGGRELYGLRVSPLAEQR
jgi:hypothetical protein